VALVHHDLCFGCGQTNLFGLMLEADRGDGETLAGRCFVKQDHQGADRAVAHEGVLAAALCEAMALACGPGARAESLEIELTGSAPVGTFLELTATPGQRSGERAEATATASSEDRVVATARGRFRIAGHPEHSEHRAAV
jgi:acyl-coenzyme A thioesterase PaaI-like protein